MGDLIMATNHDDTDANPGALHLPARIIPVPRSISPRAQAFMAQAAAISGGMPWPQTNDKDTWRTFIAAVNQGFESSALTVLAESQAHTDTTRIAGVTTYVATPHDMPESARSRTYLYLHGGALVLCEGLATKAFSAHATLKSGCTVYGVDYRNPPDHPYPAALDDCVAVYRALVETHAPENMIVEGTSGGASLAAALMFRLRDAGVPLPAAVLLLTPELDLTESGDTFSTNQTIDVVIKGRMPEPNAAYAAGADLADPYISPLFGNFSKGFPPTFLHAGTRDVFLSNAARMHRALVRAGIPAELHVSEGMPHAGFHFGFGSTIPEDLEVIQLARNFCDRHWAS
jgi:epsilon-lactone hydrolase